MTWRKRNGAALRPSARRVMAALCRFVRGHGYPPTLRELVRACGWAAGSINWASELLGELEDAGYLTLGRPQQARAIKLLRDEHGEPWGPRWPATLTLGSGAVLHAVPWGGGG